MSTTSLRRFARLLSSIAVRIDGGKRSTHLDFSPHELDGCPVLQVQCFVGNARRAVGAAGSSGGTACGPYPAVAGSGRQRVRRLHYSPRTEEAYDDWCRAFVRFRGLRHQAEMGGPEAQAFLRHLAAVVQGLGGVHGLLARSLYGTGLRWEWEVAVPELGTSVFIVPGNRVKNGDDRVVVLNRVAHSVVESVRGSDPVYIFGYRGRSLSTMHNTAWQSARRRAGLPQARVHDLKHTFGRRLRAAGVSFEDRQDLLGHRSGRITTHYSAAELSSLIEAANKVCEQGSRKSPELVLLKKKAPTPYGR